MGDGFDNGFVGGGGVEEYKGVVGFIGVVFVNGFGKSGEVSVFVESVGFADVDGRVFAAFGTFGYKNDILIGVFRI